VAGCAGPPLERTCMRACGMRQKGARPHGSGSSGAAHEAAVIQANATAEPTRRRSHVALRGAWLVSKQVIASHAKMLARRYKAPASSTHPLFPRRGAPQWQPSTGASGPWAARAPAWWCTPSPRSMGARSWRCPVAQPPKQPQQPIGAVSNARDPRDPSARADMPRDRRQSLVRSEAPPSGATHP